MVFTREGIIYNKAKPALYSSRDVEALESLTVQRSRVRANPEGRRVSPSNAWVCSINGQYHFLPRGSKTGSSEMADSFKLTNAGVFAVGDELTLLQPHTVLDVSTVSDGDEVVLTVENMSDKMTVDISTGGTVKGQLTDYINTMSRLGRVVYAIADDSADKVHLFSKTTEQYTVSATGASVSDTALVPMRPIGKITTLRTDKEEYNTVTVEPSSEANAIALADIPTGAVIDAPVYQEIMGLFNDTIDFENFEHYNIAPITAAAGMNVFALSHFDDTLAQMFPKIRFHKG